VKISLYFSCLIEARRFPAVRTKSIYDARQRRSTIGILCFDCGSLLLADIVAKLLRRVLGAGVDRWNEAANCLESGDWESRTRDYQQSPLRDTLQMSA
jgi:hypothetical protein